MNFGMDYFFGYDMQKDTFITQINTVSVDDNNINKVHSIKIDSLEINGEDWIDKYGGYLDIGIIDTMKDLFINSIGAITFAIIGYFYSKYKKDGIVKKLLINSVE